MKITPHALWWNFIKDRKWVYIFGSFLVALTGAMQVVAPKVMGEFIDLFKDKSAYTFEDFQFLAIIYFACYIVMFIGRVGWRKTLARQTHHSAPVLRYKVWKHARNFSNDDLSKDMSPGALMNASTSDVNTAKFVYGFVLVGLFDVIFLGIFTITMMFVIDPVMTLYCLACFPLLPYIIKKYCEVEADRYKEAQEYLTEFNNESSQAVSTIRLQRLTQTGGFWQKKLIESADQYRSKRIKAIFTSLRFFPIMGLFTITSYGLLFYFGLTRVFEGSMSLGDFVVMQSYLFLIQDPLMELGFILADWRRSFASLERLCDIYNRPRAEELVKDGINLNPNNNVLELDKVSFEYPHQNENEKNEKLLDKFELKIQSKERIGITGKIGTGKTTLVNILSGLERRYEGKVKLYGKSIDEYSHESLRKHIGIVPQRPFLFADTIRENICLGQDLTDDEIWKYLDIAGLRPDVLGFPKKLDTFLGEWGINLSGGQKQRLTLARALARDPSILFLDDCLSAVDTVTEEKILKSLDEHLSDTALVWVAHRDSTLKYCHRILELDS